MMGKNPAAIVKMENKNNEQVEVTKLRSFL